MSTSTSFSSARYWLTSWTMPIAMHHRTAGSGGRRGSRRPDRSLGHDAGPGVPAAEREAVFDRYVRFDTGGRAGLGLTIAKTFVEAHGEHIWVEDVPGGGARFAFTFRWRHRGADR